MKAAQSDSRHQVGFLPRSCRRGVDLVFGRWNGGARDTAAAVLLLVLLAAGAQAQDRDPMVIHEANGTTVRGNL